MFRDRVDAGRQLAQHVHELWARRPDRARADLAIVGLPRGGVPVAEQVALVLGAPLDLILVRKLGVPGQSELAMGAIGEGDVEVVDEQVLRMAQVTKSQFAEVEERERTELDRRTRRYRVGRERLPLAGRVAVIVDDGVATGSTARAACEVARAHGADEVVLAVPVASRDVERRMAGAADEIIALTTPEPFYGIGQFYADFSQSTDDDVTYSLDRAANAVVQRTSAVPLSRPGLPFDDDVDLRLTGVVLPGRLRLPAECRGLAVFAHGTGSNRHSPRNQRVADVLNRAGLGTLLFDLETTREASAAPLGIGELGIRLAAVVRLLDRRLVADRFPIVLVGSSSGAAVALRAAADLGGLVAAVVSRGGRPDLASASLPRVRCPTLLIVGGYDDTVVDVNAAARSRLGGPSEMLIIPGASHLFDEPGTLEQAAFAARDWLLGQLPSASSAIGA